MQKKVICHLCLHGPYNEGWNYQENILPKYHVKLGYDVYQIVTPYKWEGTEIVLSSDEDYTNSNGIVIHRCKPNKGFTLGGRLTRYPELMELLKKIKPDILFIHDVQCLDISTVVRYLKKNRDCVVYVDNHSDLQNSASNFISKNLLHKVVWKHMAQKINPYVRKFYGVLPARVDFLINMYNLPADKCELLVMGGDDDLVRKAENSSVGESIRKMYNVGEDDFLIVSGGKIDKAKTQIITLMETVKDLPDQNVKLLIFGSVDPTLADRINEMSDGDRIEYVGWIEPDRIYDFFEAADLVVFPCLHSVLWEQAAAQGKPMLVRHLNGTTHIDCGGNVEFLHTCSKEEMDESIKRIIDIDYINMKKAAQEAKEKFMYSNIAKKSIS